MSVTARAVTLTRLVNRRWAFVVALVAIACDRSAVDYDQPRSASAAPLTTGARSGSALRDGDIIFHESTSRQSEMVRALTRSRWTHMGVVFLDSGRPVVLEAVSPVRYTPFAQWTARGRGKHYVVKRLRDADVRLQPAVIREMRAVAARWLGRPYDLQFRWEDDSLYCSELVYKLFDRGARVRIGRIQRAREMNLEDERARAARSARFAPGQFDPNESVVTPVSIFDDDQLITVVEK